MLGSAAGDLLDEARRPVTVGEVTNWTFSDVEQSTAIARDALRFMVEDGASVGDSFRMLAELYGVDQDMSLIAAVIFRYAGASMRALAAAGAIQPPAGWAEGFATWAAERGDPVLREIVAAWDPGELLRMIGQVGAEAGGVQLASVGDLPEPFAPMFLTLLGFTGYLIHVLMTAGSDLDAIFGALSYLFEPRRVRSYPVAAALDTLLRLRLNVAP